MFLNDDELRCAHTFDELCSIIYNAKDNDRWTTNHVLDLLDIESMLNDVEEQVQDDVKLFSEAIKPIIYYLLNNLDSGKVNLPDIKEIVREQEKENLRYIENKPIHWLFYEVLGHIDGSTIQK